MERFEPLERVGGGAFGMIFKALDTTTGNVVALKIIFHDDDDGEKKLSADREIACSAALPEHVNISSILHSFHHAEEDGSDSGTILVFNLMERDLLSYINSVRYVPKEIVKNIMRQTLHALRHCHHNGIMHRDIKPENLLVDADMNVKLTDFGLGRKIEEGLSLCSNVVTLSYRSPELLLHSRYHGGEVDVWAAGCIFAELASGRVLFPGLDERSQLLYIFSLLGTPTVETWPCINRLPVPITQFERYPGKSFSARLNRIGTYGLDLLSKLLTLNPSDRITAAEALDHPYFYN